MIENKRRPSPELIDYSETSYMALTFGTENSVGSNPIQEVAEMVHTLEDYDASTYLWQERPRAGRRVHSRGSRGGSPYWILVEPDPPLTVFTLEARNGALTLPVFSSHEEILCFASEAPEGRETLRARQTGGGELISLLSAPLRGVRHIALDPPGAYLPETLELVRVGRGVFLDRLLGRGRSWMEESYNAAYSSSQASPAYPA